MEMSEYQEAIKELEWRREVAPNGRTDVPGHLEWKVGVLSALESIFGEGSRPVREFERLVEGVERKPLWGSNEVIAKNFLDKAIASAKKKLADGNQRQVPSNSRPAQRSRMREKSGRENNKVFVVHGHNDFLREQVARFLEKLGLQPVILREQPNQGRTIIEKFTEYAEVAFALILLTGDDVGGPKNVTADDLRARARQNVILELGYFLGRLGRKHVCALLEPGVEVPSDYSGVVFIELDGAGAWRMLVAKELYAAGLPIDMNAML